MTWDWWADFHGWWTTDRVGATAAAVAATAAVFAAVSGLRTLRQNRRDSRARSRPMVAAELRDDPYSDATQIFVVRNYGPSIARNVRVTFDPAIPDPSNPKASGTPFLKRRYAAPIAVMTPGMELDNVYYTGEQVGDTRVNREPTPEQVTVTITYENDTGHRFTDEFPLDTNLIRSRTYVESSKSPEARMKVIAESAKTMASMAQRADVRANKGADQAREKSQ